jgi:hypothetical protein
LKEKKVYSSSEAERRFEKRFFNSSQRYFFLPTKIPTTPITPMNPNQITGYPATELSEVDAVAVDVLLEDVDEFVAVPVPVVVVVVTGGGMATITHLQLEGTESPEA